MDRYTEVMVKGYEAMTNKDYKEAKKWFSLAIEEGCASGYQQLGILYKDANAFRNAVKQFNNYLKFYPNDSYTHYQIAYCYAKIGGVTSVLSCLAYLDKSRFLGSKEAAYVLSKLLNTQENVSNELKKIGLKAEKEAFGLSEAKKKEIDDVWEELIL